jgi:putative cell wall-binding protein
MSLTKKQKYSIFLALSLIISIGAIVGYRMWAASSFDLLSDSTITISSTKNVRRIDDSTLTGQAIKTSKLMYPSGGSPAVVISRGAFPEEQALAASLASALKSPLLMSGGSSVQTRTIDEIKRLNPSTIYAVGTTTNLSSSVDTQLKNAFPTKTFKRMVASDRYYLASSIGQEMIRLNGGTLKDRTVILVNSTSVAAAQAPYVSGLKNYPVLYAGSTIPAATSNFLNTYKPTRSIVLGQTDSSIDTNISKFPGVVRIGGANRYVMSVNLLNYAKNNLGIISYANIGIGPQNSLAKTMFASPYSAKLGGGVLVDDFKVNSTIATALSKYKSYGLSKIAVFDDDLNLSNTSLLKFANYAGSDYTSKQISLQNMVDDRIKKCPILTGTIADYGDAKGYQAITYYMSGKIVISPSHTADLTRIVNHEIYHVVDWRDNGKIDWGENIPRTDPDCIP